MTEFHRLKERKKTTAPSLKANSTLLDITERLGKDLPDSGVLLAT